MNPVVHFEMPAEDPKRMSGFYTRAFGWQTKQLGPEGNRVGLLRPNDMTGAAK